MKQYFLSLHHKRITGLLSLLAGLILILSLLFYWQAGSSLYLFLGLCSLFVIVGVYIVYLGTNFQYRKTLKALNSLYSNLEDLQTLQSVIQPRYLMPNTRIWSASPDFLKLLVDHILQEKPKAIVELGSGVSSIYISYLLEKQGAGKLFSVDHEAKYIGETEKNLEKHGLRSWVELFHAPLVPTQLNDWKGPWYDPEFLGEIPEEIDLLIVDGPPWKLQHNIRYPAVPVLLDKLSPNGVVFVDDYIRKDEKAMVARWIADYPGFELETYPTDKGTAIIRRKEIAL